MPDDPLPVDTLLPEPKKLPLDTTLDTYLRGTMSIGVSSGK